jgi:diacylglycerol kinase
MIRVGRLLRSFNYAFKGLFKVFREEQNLRIQSIASALVIILGVYFQINLMAWALLCVVIGLVLITEITNSAVERITDVLKPRINSYVKEIKDIMAAAVLLSSLVALAVGVLVFIPYVYKLFGQF